MSGFYSEEYNRTFPDQPEGPEYAPYTNKGSGTKPSISKSTLAALVAAAAMTVALFSPDFDVDNIQSYSAIFEYDVKSEEGDLLTYELITGGETVQEGFLDLDDDDLLFDDLTPDTRYSVKIFKNRAHLDTIHFRTKPLGGDPSPENREPISTGTSTEPSSGISSEPTAESVTDPAKEATEMTTEETVEKATEETVPETTEETTDPTEETTEPTEETKPKWPPYKPSRPKPRPTESTDPTDESTEPTEESVYPSEENTYPSEENTYPSEENTYPSEENTYPSEDPVYPSEGGEGENTYPSENPVYPSEGGEDIPENTGAGGEVPENTGAGGEVPENTGAGGEINPTEGNSGIGGVGEYNLFSLRNFFSFLMTVIRL